MGRRRALLAGAAACAAVSALGLGAGIVGLAPILRNILNDGGATLPELAAKGAARLRDTIGVDVPRAWIDALPDGRFDAVLWLVGALVMLTFVGATANFLHAYLSQTLATRVIAGVRRDAFRRALHMPLKAALAQSHAPTAHAGTAEVSGVSDIVSRIINDSIRLNSGFLALVDKGPAQVTKGAIAFVAAVFIDWRSLAAVPVAVIMGIIIRKLGKRVRRAARGAMEAQSRLMHTTTESLQGLRVVKAHAAERFEMGRFSRVNRAFLRETLRARTARAVAGPLLETLGILVMGAWALIFANQIINHDMAPGSFLAALAGLGVAAASLKPLSSIVQEVQGAAPAATRLARLVHAEIEEPLRPAGKPRPRLPRHARSIDFERVSFTYPHADSPALRAVSLSIAHGETVAFVGGNGSGKTTLLSLLPRLLTPDSGRVLIDGADIAGVSLRSLRRQIGVVTQEVVLFQGTIRSNIAYGAGGATPERIEHAARLARAHEFISAKPGGYDARVGDQGVTLSGGQRQRIAIARAFLRDPAILILDEATSMIDAESEAQIADAIADFSRGRTTLIIAHRLSTVINADRIVALDEGRVLDVGRHDELIGRCPTYRTLTAAQLISAPAGA